MHLPGTCIRATGNYEKIARGPGIVKWKICGKVKECEHYGRPLTDDFSSYDRIGKFYAHEKVRHTLGEYVRQGGIHTNGVESFWALFKRGYVGIYHWMSPKHLHRCADEFVHRFNSRTEEFAETFRDAVNRVSQSDPLPYKVLTA